MSCRILYLTLHDPFGESYGAQERSLHVGRALSRVGRVTLVLASIGKTSFADIQSARREFDDVKILRMTEIPRYTEYVRRNLTLGIRHSFEFRCSLEQRLSFARWASENDMIWCHGLRIASALELDGKKRIFVDIDDIQSQIMRSETVLRTDWLGRAKLWLQWAIWRCREARLTGHVCRVRGVQRSRPSLSWCSPFDSCNSQWFSAAR